MIAAGEVRRILQVHTRYRQAGGEDAVVEAERRLLSAAGFEVSQILFDNGELGEGRSIAGDLRLARSTVWSRPARQRVADALDTSAAQVMHVHNTFAAASPSVYGAAVERGLPVVQTLHNYRLVCPSATAFRDGRACTDCVGLALPWPGVLHACVRGSRRQSLVAATSAIVHRARGTYTREVDRYIVLTEFQRRLLLEGGLPAENIGVVPNFLEPDPGIGSQRRAGIIFVGRLSEEKGLRALVQASRLAPGLVSVFGDGPLISDVEDAARDRVLAYRGPLQPSGILVEMRNAAALVLPSIWFEGLPMVVLEAFATATPVIASRIGSLAELVEDGVTGLTVEPGDPIGLAERIRWTAAHPDDMRSMGAAARAAYEARFRGEAHLAALRAEYEAARWAAAARPGRSA